MNRYWKVNPVLCCLVGTTYASSGYKPAILAPTIAARMADIWREIVFVSICHQTNWDRLHEHVLQMSRTHSQYLSLEFLRQLDAAQFVRLFAPGIDENRLRTRERLGFLRSLAQSVPEWPDRSARWLGPGRVSLAGESGLYAWLSRIQAFAEDPLQKKSRVLVHQLLRYGLIEVEDEHSILPAVDYHLMRLYVRTARVSPCSPEYLQRMVSDSTARVEFHFHLRQAVEEAMQWTQTTSGLRMDHLNHVEWQIARSYCTRMEARCHLEPLETKPLDDLARAILQTPRQCPLAVDCMGCCDERLRNVRDPKSAKGFY